MSVSIANRNPEVGHQEKLVRKEFAPDVADWMLKNWIDAKNYHASWWASKGMWFCKKEPISKAAIVRSLTSSAANTPIGAYYIDADGNVKHLTIDIDAHKDGEAAEPELRRATDLLNRVGIPFTVARSKGGKGYHLRIHFDHPLPAHVARNLGLDLVKAAGLPEKTEVFPKQDALREGEYGSQAALPGSLAFFAKTGGSVLLDPVTLQPIPFGEWLDYLNATQPLSEKTLRALCAESGRDLWQKRERPRPTFKPEDFVAEGVPDFETVECLVGFLSRNGIEVQREKGAFGDWTDRLLLLDCPNAQAHGSDRKDGAAVLYNAATKRVGFKCWHEGCSLFSWPKLLKKLGFRFRKKNVPEPDQEAVPPEDHEPTYTGGEYEYHEPGCGCGCEAVEEPHEKEDRPIDHHLSEDERIEWRLAARSREAESLKGLTRIILKCARCCESWTKMDCVPGPNGEEGHGTRSMTPDRCGNPRLCPNCVRVQWRKNHRPNVEDNWPEQAFVAIVPIAHPTQAEAELKRLAWAFRRNRDEKPRWFKGWKHVVYFFAPEHEVYARKWGDLDGKLMTREEYLPILQETWLSYSVEMLALIRQVGIIEALRANPWFLAPNMKRTSAGKAAQKLFPWLSTDDCKKQSKQAWRDKHPGLEPGECDSIVGHNPDGTPVYCKRLCCVSKGHRRTHRVYAVKRGPFKDSEFKARFDEEDDRYLEAKLAESFTAET